MHPFTEFNKTAPLPSVNSNMVPYKNVPLKMEILMMDRGAGRYVASIGEMRKVVSRLVRRCE
jgi:hypothetical protein